MDFLKEKERIKTEIDTIQDETLTVEELRQRALATQKAISEGRVISIEGLEKEANEW